MPDRAALAFGAALLGWSSAVLADNHPLVRLEIDSCVEAPRGEIRRVVTIELGALLSDADEPAPGQTRAIVSCEGAFVRLRVEDPITRKSLTRTFEIASSIPEARGRLVALAVVELISASWTELDTNPQPQVPPSGPPPSREARETALAAVRAQIDLRTPPSFRLLAIGGVLGFSGGTGVLGGGGLRLVRDRSARIGWMVDLQAHRGTADATLGAVATQILSVGAYLVADETGPRWSLRLGGGLRGGAVNLSGDPGSVMAVQGNAFWAPWVGVAGLVGVELAVTRSLVVGLTGEGGLVVLPVGGLVADRREVAVDGTWFGLQVGGGMSW